MNKYIRLLRVNHYIKNLLIILPAFLVKKITEPDILMINLMGIIIFSFTASIIYIINDIRDVEADRNHPIKCNRPIASNQISVGNAYFIIIVLSIICMVISIISGSFTELITIPVIYFLINLLYSFGLKNYALVDVFILMMCYLLRLIYGGILAGSGVSTWMFLTMMSGALFLSFGKRYGELKKYEGITRRSLLIYTEEFLNQAMMISCSLTIVFYALTCADTNSAVKARGIDLLWSVPGGVFLAFRYLLLLRSGDNDGDPIYIISGDKLFIILCIGFFVVLGFMLYYK